MFRRRKKLSKPKGKSKKKKKKKEIIDIMIKDKIIRDILTLHETEEEEKKERD